MDEIHVHKTKKSICAHFAESPCIRLNMLNSVFMILVYVIRGRSKNKRSF